MNNIRKVEHQSQTAGEGDYFKFWEELLASSICPQFTSFQEADSMLEKLGKSVVFLIDGLEEILVNLSASQEECKAIQVLCQDIVSQLVAQYHHLGIIIMPSDIRAAVSTCSSEKMDEVKQEYVMLKPIFEKLEKLSLEEKLLPIDPFHVKLTKEEESSMIREGYLKRDNDKYYLPEIARHALGFRYGKGARPKVLSLTLKQ